MKSTVYIADMLYQSFTFMKLSPKVCIVLLGFLAGCDSASINGGYRDIGKFSTRIEAQNGGINYILKNYESLPKGDYKIKYSITNTTSTERSPNALWYNKDEARLAIERDLGSGTACKWTEVTRTVLEQALKATDSLSKIDSLAKSDQPLGQCR